jgi:hypothetical protein
LTAARRVPAGVAALALALPASASAHGLVGKQDLPIPRWLFAWAAAVVLIVSFVGLAVLWARPRLQSVTERRRLSLPLVLEVLAGTIGVAGFIGCIYVGFAGVQIATANPLPTVIFVFFWVGPPFLALFLGDVFAPLNPWRAVGRATGWLVGRVAGEPPAPLPYPERLGRWPAALGILVFAWVELVYAGRDDPSQLAVMALAYAAVQLIGMSLYGTKAWCSRGDAFGVYLSLFARLSPLHWRARTLFTRPTLGGAPPLPVVPGTVALLCCMIGTTSFDGFSQGALWNSIAPHLQDAFASMGFSAEHALEWAGTMGIIAMVLLVAGLYRLGVEGMRTVGRTRRSTAELSAAFVHTLIPIALAYVVAHYFSLVAYNGQGLPALLSDPLGDGSDLLGLNDTTINYTWISATGIWYVQVGALVLGHASGLALAHDRALALYDKARDATRSQYWMLAVMVAFTSLGLWLLSAAAGQ